MRFIDFYNSVYAVMRIDSNLAQNNARIAGSAFVICSDPVYLLTCHHVVSEGNATNTAPIFYSITKRTGTDHFDLRTGQFSYLRVAALAHFPDRDLAVLTIDPGVNATIAQTLGIAQSTALPLSFDPADRQLGDHVEWLTAAATGNLSLTPRFFRGHVVTRYISNHAYNLLNPQGQQQQHVMQGAHILEVDKLFLPGASGSPILHSQNDRVIGYVHGFNAWPIPVAPQPVMASLSLGIDVMGIQDILNQNAFI